MEGNESILSIRNVCMYFPGVKALDGVDFDLHEGEIHALLGENGAGKSTLIKVVTGVYKKTSGRQMLSGAEISPVDVAHAQRLGISTVYQEVNLIPNLTVAQNLFLGREPKTIGFVNTLKMNELSRKILSRYEISIDVSQPLANYSVAIQQMVAIARGVDMSAKVLILDEPTASLDRSEVRSLFAVMRGLRDKGLAIVFVTHFLTQVYEVCDRITVLRNGKRVAEYPVSELSEEKLVRLMLGKEICSSEKKIRTINVGNDNERIFSMTSAGIKRRMHPIDLSISAGEVVGLAGLLGSGRTELCEMIFGVTPFKEGLITIGERVYSLFGNKEAMSHGLGLCPEDRKRDGIFASMSICENIAIALQVKLGWWRSLGDREKREIAGKQIAAMGIVTTDIDKRVGDLSGGNQQKVILARWLATEPKLLLLDEPTRGIDVGAHAEIIKLIRKLCEKGMALIVASSEIDELVQFSDRVVVLRDRKKVKELSGTKVNPSAILESIAGAN